VRPSPSSDAVLEAVHAALSELLEAAAAHGGLLPSILDRRTGRMPDRDRTPPAIPGQRESDRAPRGCNLLDDVPLLATLEALADDGRPAYAAAVDDYLGRFVAAPARTPTGLFPWGDHAYWDLDEDRAGDSYVHAGSHDERAPVHDQRALAPPWLFERLHEHDPAVVQGFADGLEHHWIDRPRRFNRHAWIERPDRERGGWGPADRSCDFPRHSGTFVLDWAAAHALEERPATRERIETMADYWWPRRDDRGLVPYESEGHTDPSPEQTLSLSVCLFEAAVTLPDSADDLAADLRRRGESLARGFAVSAPRGAPVWASGYPNAVRAATGLASLTAYRHAGDDRLLAWARTAGEAYVRLPFPEGIAIPAEDAGLALGLLADLYAETGRERWREAGLALAGEAIERYCDGPLPRAATGIDRYESALGTGHLLRGIARVALVAREDDPALPAGTTLLPAGYQHTESFPF